MRLSKQIYNRNLLEMSQLCKTKPDNFERKHLCSIEAYDAIRKKMYALTKLYKSKGTKHIKDPIDYQEMLFFNYEYQIATHLVCDSYDDNLDGKDIKLSALNELDDNIFIDFKFNCTPYFAWIIQPDSEMAAMDKLSGDTNGSAFKRICGIYDDHSFIIVGVTEDEKIYILPSVVRSYCSRCGLCTGEYKGCPQCRIENDLYDLLKIAIYAAERYKNRDKFVTVKRKSQPTKRALQNIHVARKNETEDEILIPLERIVYQYNESPKRESRGGTHASPCEHKRKQHFRKSRIGDHIYVNGEFIPVEKGTGTFTLIDATIVNKGKGRKPVYKV